MSNPTTRRRFKLNATQVAELDAGRDKVPAGWHVERVIYHKGSAAFLVEAGWHIEPDSTDGDIFVGVQDAPADFGPLGEPGA